MISKIDKKSFLLLNIKTSDAGLMAFYKVLSEKSKVHGDDFKNR
ncbi:hypothetical protein T4D_6937 [Trichinella pseudospiralis]|uniref:Uncharacterized protein n=1 Tax=Trichinella pseudospiralis TaxID=6337 RepID=A0A0V1CD00_TRIPS|nr:hypothetical protein T4D_6937 [Trichinella pseudospiralis]